MRMTQLDKAITSLEAKKADILTKANAEAAALESAILTLKAQKVKKASRPRTLAMPEKVGA